MKFFIDTANLAQIKEAQDLGVLDGVTTNPSLMAKEGIKGQQNILKHYQTKYLNIHHQIQKTISTDFQIAQHQMKFVFEMTVHQHTQ